MSRPTTLESPGHQQGAFSQGLQFAAIQHWGPASRCFAQSLESSGLHPAALYNLGMSQWQLARHDLALASFDSALRLDPDNPRHLLAKSRLIVWREQCHRQLGADSVGGPALCATSLGHHHSHALFALQDAVVMRQAGLPLLDSRADARRWLSWQQARAERLTLGLIEPEYGLVGAVSLRAPDDSLLGSAGHFYYWIGAGFQGRGFGGLALRLLLEIAASKRIEMLWSFVDDANTRSQRLLRSRGFHYIPRPGTTGGEFRLYLDAKAPHSHVDSHSVTVVNAGHRIN